MSFDAIDGDRRRQIFAATIERAALDADGRAWGTTVHERREADRWFRQGGEDFHHVCSLAGFDPDFIREAFLAGRLTSGTLRSRS